MRSWGDRDLRIIYAHGPVHADPLLGHSSRTAFSPSVASMVSALALAFVVLIVLRETSAESVAPRVEVDRYHKPKGCDDKRTRRSELGDYIQVHFTGRVGAEKDGKIFDDTRNSSGKPLEFQMKRPEELNGMFIQGWTEAMTGMCVGEKRIAVIPPSLAFGDAGLPNVGIPAKSYLRFDIELITMSDEPSADGNAESPYPNIWREWDANKDKFVTKEEVKVWFQKTKESANGGQLPEAGIDGLMKLFDKDDKDGDGKLSFDEFSGPKGLPPGKRPNNRGVPVDSDGMVPATVQSAEGDVTVLDGVKVKVEAQGPGGEAVKLPEPITIKQDVEKPKKEARTEL